MKKIVTTLALSLSLASSAFATNGYLYLQNVNSVFQSTNKIQFKVVAKNSDGSVLKTVETGDILASQVFSYKLSDFGLTTKTLDIYARDLNKSHDYNQCMDGYPFASFVTMIFHGWTESKNATCIEAVEIVDQKL